MQRGVVRAAAPPHRTVLLWLARNFLFRASIFAVVFSILSIPIGLGALLVGGESALTYQQFLVFKLSFAIALGMLVTPLNAALVLCEPKRARRQVEG
ncbi:MAG: hypothetical protein WDO69_34900 [Pseudomonadota bacterium]